jgi:hypothetical protein
MKQGVVHRNMQSSAPWTTSLSSYGPSMWETSRPAARSAPLTVLAYPPVRLCCLPFFWADKGLVLAASWRICRLIHYHFLMSSKPTKVVSTLDAARATYSRHIIRSAFRYSFRCRAMGDHQIHGAWRAALPGIVICPEPVALCYQSPARSQSYVT